jgi:hypothetical protein
MPQAIAALRSDSSVIVSVDEWLVFQPAQREAITGLVFYPGGRVDPRAYAPAASAIAAEGYLVVVVPMPLNLAVLGPGRAVDVMANFGGVQHWAVGGHSLGGSMAAKFAFDNPDLVEGLVLWASYPAGSNDLSSYELAVSSVYGTEDGLATREEIAQSGDLLPTDTRWVAISGGNHAQFGWYGPQRGDNAAGISREAQQEQVVAATVDLLRRLD